MCKIEGEDESEEDLMTCTSCQQKYHPLCLDVNDEMLSIIKTYSWQCIDCKSCAKCSKTHDEVMLVVHVSFQRMMWFFSLSLSLV